MSEEHPSVTGRDKLLVLCHDATMSTPVQQPTEEYPYHISFVSKTPIVICGHIAGITERFYERVKDFPDAADHHKELMGVFKDFIIEQ